jgi:hypothetical protein
MPSLLSSGNRVGTSISNAYQIPPEWEGLSATVYFTIPERENETHHSFWFYLEVANSEAGPWELYAGLHWKGGYYGKDGSWDPSKTWVVKPELVGKWVRGRIEVPDRMRFELDIDVE